MFLSSLYALRTASDPDGGGNPSGYSNREQAIPPLQVRAPFRSLGTVMGGVFLILCPLVYFPLLFTHQVKESDYRKLVE